MDLNQLATLITEDISINNGLIITEHSKQMDLNQLATLITEDISINNGLIITEHSELYKNPKITRRHYIEQNELNELKKHYKINQKQIQEIFQSRQNHQIFRDILLSLGGEPPLGKSLSGISHLFADSIYNCEIVNHGENDKGLFIDYKEDLIHAIIMNYTQSGNEIEQSIEAELENSLDGNKYNPKILLSIIKNIDPDKIWSNIKKKEFSIYKKSPYKMMKKEKWKNYKLIKLFKEIPKLTNEEILTKYKKLLENEQEAKAWTELFGQGFLTKTTIDEIKKHLRGNKLIDLMAGTGYQAQTLRNSGINTIAYDIDPGKKYHYKIQKADINDIAPKLKNADIFLSWPAQHLPNILPLFQPNTRLFLLTDAGMNTSAERFDFNNWTCIHASKTLKPKSHEGEADQILTIWDKNL